MSVTAALRLSHAPVAAFMVIGLYWGTFAAFVPEIKAQIGASDALFGMLLLCTSFGLVSSMWLAPRLDRLLGARGMAMAARAMALAFLLPGLATGPLGFGAAMLVVGLCSGLTDVVMNARVSELEARHARPLMNANHAMFSVAYAIAAVATGIAREAGMPPAGMFALVGCVVFYLSTRMHMEIEPIAEDGAGRSPFPWGAVLICGLVVLIAFMTEAAIEAWSALHVERTLGGSAAQGALGPAMLGLTMAVGRFSGQAVAERLDDFTVIYLGAGMAATGALLAAAAPSPLAAYAGFGILGLGVSVIGPLGIALAGQMSPPDRRTEAISRAAVIGFMGFFLAPVLVGGLSQLFGLRMAFVGVAFLVATLFVIAPVQARMRATLRARLA